MRDEGAAAPEARSRGSTAGWLIVLFAAVLVGWPLGILFLDLGLGIEAWLLAYGVATAIAIAAAWFFMLRGTRTRSTRR